MKKVCSKCGEEKESECFNKNNAVKSGLYSHCKSCRKEYIRKYYLSIKEKAKKYNKEYQGKNKEKIKIKSKNYRQKNKERINQKRRESYSKLSKEEKKKLFKTNNEWQRKNRDYLNKYAREYRQKNKQKVQAIVCKSTKKRLKKDVTFRLSHSIRCSISSSIRRMGYTKKSRTYKILGCTFEELKQHLKSQFQEGMTWDNYGRDGWHIDHIYPVSKARDEQHLLELNHYTNLQPLWKRDNMAKGNRLDWSE